MDEWIANLAEKGQVRKVIRTAYVADKQAGGDLQPNAYPGPCVLATVVYTSYPNIYNSSLTSCSAQVTYVGHAMWLSRSRWYGWETMRSENKSKTGLMWSFASSTTAFDCHGTQHNWKAETTGHLEYAGVDYYASGSAQINNYYCVIWCRTRTILTCTGASAPPWILQLAPETKRGGYRDSTSHDGHCLPGQRSDEQGAERCSTSTG